ncbi:hypothetical protein JW851_00035 [Candidatus Woesearchaeota archaeon]|nr:hypothetical protein [Candidatus Woesearchaeota archaeon]
MSEDKRAQSVVQLVIEDEEIPLLDNPGNWNIFFNPLKPNEENYFKWIPHYEVATQIRKILLREGKSYQKILEKIYLNS